MGKKKPFPPPPANNLHEYREEVGLSKTDLAKLSDLSDKTIARIEKQKETFRSTTYRRVFNALNKARRKESMAELKFDDVFPTK
jgi:predicted transcriptional regulator